MAILAVAFPWTSTLGQGGGPNMTNGLHTVFEIGLWGMDDFSGLIFRLLIGAVSLFLGIRRFGRDWAGSVFVIVFAVVWVSVHAFLMRTYLTNFHALRSGQSEVVEGIVHVSHEQPYHGHSAGDRITVGSR